MVAPGAARGSGPVDALLGGLRSRILLEPGAFELWGAFACGERLAADIAADWLVFHRAQSHRPAAIA